MWFLVVFSVVVFLTQKYFQTKKHVKKYEKFYGTPSSPYYVPIFGNVLEIFVTGRQGLLSILSRGLDKYTSSKKELLVYIPWRLYITTCPDEAKIILNESLDKSSVYQHLNIIMASSLLVVPDLLGKVCYLMENYGKDSKFALTYLPFKIYITSVPEENRIILNNSIDKSILYNHLNMVFLGTLLVEKATIWRKNRKLFSRSFKQNILDSFVATFDNKCKILVKLLKENHFEDVCEVFETYTLDIFCEATIGIKSSILADQDKHFTQCITKIQNILFGRIGNLFKMSDYTFPYTSDGREATKHSDYLHKFIKDVINRKRANADDKEFDINAFGLPVLDLLLEIQEKEKLTDEYITREMILFAGAATDTTAYSLGYIFLMLAMNPDAQEKVFEEATTVLGDRDVEAADLVDLKYTEMAINEAMRIFPVVPLVARKTLKDLDIGSKVIPRNTDIVVDFFHMHRDETIYPEPLVYKPERFLPEEVKKRHPYSFLPFSGGPRNCIGFKYAQMVLKLTVASVVKNFEITTSHKSVEEIEVVSAVVMTPKTPLDLKFTPREH